MLKVFDYSSRCRSRVTIESLRSFGMTTVCDFVTQDLQDPDSAAGVALHLPVAMDGSGQR